VNAGQRLAAVVTATAAGLRAHQGRGESASAIEQRRARTSREQVGLYGVRHRPTHHGNGVIDADKIRKDVAHTSPTALRAAVSWAAT
jgi:hypothetical protein